MITAMAFVDPDNPLAVEIQQEAAEIYFGACHKMVDALEALKSFDQAVAPPTPDSPQMTRRSDLLDEAAQRVHFVVIQRDAMRFSGYEEFFENYDVPREVRMRMGRTRPI